MKINTLKIDLKKESNTEKINSVIQNSPLLFKNKYIKEKIKNNQNPRYSTPHKNFFHTETINTDNSKRNSISIIKHLMTKTNVSRNSHNKTLLIESPENCCKTINRYDKFNNPNETKYLILSKNKKLKFLRENNIDDMLVYNKKESDFLKEKNNSNNIHLNNKCITLTKKLPNNNKLNLDNKKHNNISGEVNKKNPNKKTSKSNVLKVIEKNIFNQKLKEEYKKEVEKIGNDVIQFHPKKYSELAKFIIKATNPDDCIEEHLLRDKISDRFVKFKVLLKKQERVNTNLINSVKRAASINETLVKVGFTQLLAKENLALWKKRREMKKLSAYK